MGTGITAFIISAAAVALAEMGDKSQLMAMAFATKHKAWKVMLGVFIATVFNHAIAVTAGNLLTKYTEAGIWIEGIASLSFIFFGLLTLKGEDSDEEGQQKTRFGAVLTVAIAFSVAEFGDKTQLTAIALSIKYPENPLWILAGTTAGQVMADGIGIIIGIVMCKKIPRKTIRIVSAAAFVLFGLIGTWQVLFNEVKIKKGPAIMIVAVISLVISGLAYYLIKKESGREDQNPADEYCKLKIENTDMKYVND